MTLILGRRLDPQPVVAERDGLTGLAGRDAAERSLDAALAGVAPAVFVLFGVDGLRHLNAASGVEAGDAVLRRVAEAIATEGRHADTFRLGGDLFGWVVRLPMEEAHPAVMRVMRAVGTDDDGGCVTLGAGLVDLGPCRQPSGRSVLVDADLALAAAKAKGRDRLAVFADVDRAPFARAERVADELRSALDGTGAELIFHCQPVRSTKTTAVHWELLLRLRGRDGRIRTPAEFLPAAEHFDLLGSVDRWVVQRAVSLTRQAAEQGEPIDLELNVSARSLLQRSFCVEAAERVVASGIDPSRLVFAVRDPELQGLRRELGHWSAHLRSLGCRLSLDDFGMTGPSLVRLTHLPVDMVKIDAGIVRDLCATGAPGEAVLRSVIDFVHGTGQQVAVVRVSDGETLDLVCRAGVDLVQGFHVGPPETLEGQSWSAADLEEPDAGPCVP